MKPHIERVVSDRKVQYALIDGNGKKVAIMETREGARFVLALLKHADAESDRTEET